MRAIVGTAAMWATLLLLLAAPASDARAAANSPRPAPVGHRQPTTQDVQRTEQQDNSADQAMKKMDEDLDKKLKGICHGC